jgi:NADH-quinone oxidoreductase subunit G
VQRICREALRSPHIASGQGAVLSRESLLQLARPDLTTAISELDYADAILVVDTDPLHSSPILDLRIRKAVRRSGATLAVATARPTALDGGAAAVARYAPGDGGAFLAALAGALGARGFKGAADRYADAAREVADSLAGVRNSQDAIVVWGGALVEVPDGEAAASALLAVARALGIEKRRDSGLLEAPALTNARGLREVGCTPSAGPGLSETRAGKSGPEIRDTLERGSLDAILLFGADPLRDHPDSEGWRRALGAADFVVSVAMFEDASTALADVVLPAQSHAEKDGTVTHPDGRLQRLRPSIPDPGSVRAATDWLAELSAKLGVEAPSDAFEAMTEEVPFYRGLTHERIGGRGIRWQERLTDGKGRRGRSSGDPDRGDIPSPSSRIGISPKVTPRGLSRLPATRDGKDLRLGTYRDLWAGEIPERNPALRFLVPKQRLELAPDDAQRLGVAHGDEVTVSSNGTDLAARVVVRERMAPGAGFVIEGTADENGNLLANGRPRTVTVSKGEGS